MRKIIECSLTDYVFLFGDFRTGFSDYSVKSSLESGGAVYMVLEDNETAGLLCVRCEGNVSVIAFAFTVEKYRRRGIFTYLLLYASERWRKPIKLNISTEKEHYDVISDICIKLGFVHNSTCIVYSGKSEDFVRWEEYMDKKGSKLCAMLERQGYSCVSFAAADKQQLDKIYNSGNDSFGNELDVKPFFDNPQKKMSKDMSFIVIKDNEPQAYTLISCPDKHSAVFEHISASESYVGSGCILLAFARSMEMFKKNNCRRAAYAMYETNLHANKFRQKLLGKVTSSEKRTENYILR